ncbi:MAG TPA: RluA family pseudouridine synthase [Kofleriaceae bacterium]|nr:RluA family pseudouridine synthase [Kofleriaceae bacterium]
MSEAEARERPRLDVYLAGAGLGLSRTQVKRAIESGLVRVGGEVVEPRRPVRAGDVIDVILVAPVEASAVPQAMPLSILFEDAHLIVVDKPAGLVVHPAPGHPDGTLVNALLAHCGDLSGIGGVLRPGIVHRLDKDTSGILVAAKSDAAHQGLAAMFEKKDLVREYIAVVAPAPARGAMTFDTLYGRHPKNRKKFSSRVARGKRAVTHVRVSERFGDVAAQVVCRLETGRTHQIRVHLADAGHPVVGDPVYARKARNPALAAAATALGRQALHAARLDFRHPITGEPLAFSVPPPPDMEALLGALRALTG